MDNELINDKLQNLKKTFSSKERIIDLFLGISIWGFLIVKYTDNIYSWLFKVLEPVKYSFIRSYLSYFLFGIIATLLGIAITIGIIKTLEFIKNKWRQRK